MANINDVKSFWNDNPLWTGESEHQPGTIEFFNEHRRVYIDDVFTGNFDLRFMPPPRPAGQQMKVLDLGCGIGFWTAEFAMRGLSNVFAADLTENALEITKSRLGLLGLKVTLSQQNAENLSFSDNEFDHVNCQGVIHHTPDTEKAVSEIARVIKPGGTASISVYYKNPFLKMWPYMRWLGVPLTWLGGGMKGRGRENIFLESNVDEIVRLYDGSANPVGKSYSKSEFSAMLAPYFTVNEVYYHFFPARALPFKIPKALHRWLDRSMGFMIFASLTKK